MAAPDGGLTTLSYSSGLLSTIQEPGNRTVTLQHDGSGNLTGITDEAGFSRSLGYDGNHRLTSDNWAPLSSTVSYDPTTGRVNGISLGGTTTYTLSSEAVQGLQTAPATSNGPVAVLTSLSVSLVPAS